MCLTISNYVKFSEVTSLIGLISFPNFKFQIYLEILKSDSITDPVLVDTT